jgi:glycine/D-amino acid oxidase-like deaminating enzyme
MITTPFWQYDYPRPEDLPVVEETPSSIDVAIVGSGYTGLSAARSLTRQGASVAVLEREHIGWGASSRNGGITGCGLKKGMPSVFEAYGEKYGNIFWQASLDALDLVKELAEQDGIDFDWQQKGDLCVAYKPSHYEDFKSKITWHKKKLNHELQLVPPDELQKEIGSTAYYGGVIDPHGASLHPAKLVFGLAELVAKQGAMLCEYAGVTGIEKKPKGYLLHTQRGTLQAKDVILATNGYTDNLSPELNHKTFPVGSYSIVTEPLTEELQREISPKGRVFWDSKWFLNYFRLTPDGRLLWGGRNNLSTTLDLVESEKILQEQMLRAFPQLEDVTVTHTWTGQLGLTFDLMPNIGRLQNGVYYAVGYGGHGLHTALYLGREIAQILSGEISSSPFMEIPHQTYFFYRDKTWFLPFAAYYYRFRDWIS